MTQITAPNPVSPDPDPDVGHGKAWVWPGIVVALLFMQVLICVVGYLMANSDPSQVVVSNYHEKALAWDQHMAKLRAGEALGWKAELDIARDADMLGDRTVRLSIKDADGEPLTGAAVRVEAFHFSRADQVVQAELKEAAPGEYLASMKMRKTGRWDLDFVVQKGQDVDPFTLQHQVGPVRWVPG